MKAYENSTFLYIILRFYFLKKNITCCSPLSSSHATRNETTLSGSKSLLKKHKKYFLKNVYDCFLMKTTSFYVFMYLVKILMYSGFSLKTGSRVCTTSSTAVAKKYMKIFMKKMFAQDNYVFYTCFVLLFVCLCTFLFFCEYFFTLHEFGFVAIQAADVFNYLLDVRHDEKIALKTEDLY